MRISIAIQLDIIEKEEEEEIAKLSTCSFKYLFTINKVVYSEQIDNFEKNIMIIQYDLKLFIYNVLSRWIYLYVFWRMN